MKGTMDFQEWLKDKYKDKPDDYEVDLVTEYLDYHQCVYSSLYDKAWDDFIMG